MTGPDDALDDLLASLADEALADAPARPAAAAVTRGRPARRGLGPGSGAAVLGVALAGAALAGFGLADLWIAPGDLLPWAMIGEVAP